MGLGAARRTPYKGPVVRAGVATVITAEGISTPG